MTYTTLEALSQAVSDHLMSHDMPEAVKCWKASDGYHFHPVELPYLVTDLHMTLGDDGTYSYWNGEAWKSGSETNVHHLGIYRVEQRHDSEVITPRYVQYQLENLDDPELIEPGEAIVFGCTLITWDRDESQDELEDSITWATVYATLEG